MSSGGASAGRKTSAEEKSLANAQTALLNKQGANLDSLQGILAGLGPSQLAQLGLNSSGGILQQGQMPTAPTAVADPGPKPQEHKATFSGKNWGKNDQNAQDASLRAIQDWNVKNAAYQQYQSQLGDYNNLTQQIQANPNAYYLQDPNVGRQQEQGLVDQILQGSLSPDAAASQGVVGAQSAGRAGFLQMLNKYLGTTQEDTVGQQAFDQYTNRLNGGAPEQGTLNSLLSQYGQQVAGNIPEASQLQGFLSRISTGLAGQTYINPEMQRQFDNAEQKRRTELFQQLGSGYANSSAGMEALTGLDRMRLGTIDELNQRDLASSLSGYLGLGNFTQQRQASTLQQYAGLSQQVDAQTQNLLSQYLGLQDNKRQNLNAAFTGYTGLTDFTEQSRQNAYSNELNNRLQRVGTAQQIATQPYSVDYSGLINSYTAALQASTQRQTGTAQGGSGWQAAVGKLAGSLIGTGIGSYYGGPMGGAAGGQAGGQAGGMFGGLFGGGGGAQAGGGGGGYQMYSG